MTADAITVLTFLKLKQITIKESLGVGKHSVSRGFLAIARLSCIFGHLHSDTRFSLHVWSLTSMKLLWHLCTPVFTCYW